MEPGRQPWSTAPTQPSPGWDRFDRVLRTVSMGAIVSIVLAALLGVAGLRTATVTVSNGAMTLNVNYASVSRPGISTPFRIEISSPADVPLPAELTVAVTNDYLSLFDENGLDPQPDVVHFDGQTLEWTYRVDGRRELVIDFDARLQPNVHRGRDSSVTVSTPGMEPLVAQFHTTVFG